GRWLRLIGAVAGGCLLLVLVAALRTTDAQMTQLGSGEIGLIQNLGQVLFRDYVIPFELSSILFLTAMVGAVVIGKSQGKSSTPVEDARNQEVRTAMNID
ncbi:MAG: hypothetical protein EOP49_50710, partial [Sphingobacteriales bacterium]